MLLVPNEQFWKVFKETAGAFSTAEAIALYNICLAAPEGEYAEFGTYKGKSALVALIALKKGMLHLVDPILDSESIKEMVEVIVKIERGCNFDFYKTTSIDAMEKLKHQDWGGVDAKTGEVFKVPREYGKNTGDFSYVFVDSGSHGDGLPMQEAKLLEDRMVQGGIIAFHDYKNQFTEVEIAYDYLVGTGKYERIDINWQEIFDYVKEHDLENGNNSWHIYNELPHPPNFVGALRRK